MQRPQEFKQALTSNHKYFYMYVNYNYIYNPETALKLYTVV